jgi:hypothetical protein
VLLDAQRDLAQSLLRPARLIGVSSCPILDNNRRDGTFGIE